MNNILLCLLVVGAQVKGSSSTTVGFKAYNAQFERMQYNLVMLYNIKTAFPYLTEFDIQLCIDRCASDGTLNLIDECQDLMFYKLMNK